jgi:UDP-N-acetylmuramoyl-tripeptide--D-alanyl-D-alanine ligase
LFVALQGERVDGHFYIGDALARGASVVIAEARAREQGLGGSLTLIDVAGLQPSPFPDLPNVPVVFIVPSSLAALQELAGFWRARFPKLKTVGVTGSVGKSSTKELIYTVLRRRYSTLRSPGNLNNEIGLPLAILDATPSHERAVLEMGMYGLGEIRMLCEIAKPAVGVVTNVGPVHLERLGSIENIARAKAELPEALPADGFAILNGDDARVRAMQGDTKARALFYGLGENNDLRATDIETRGLAGIAFALHYDHQHIHISVPLLGQHSVHTALAAAAVGFVEGMEWDDIIAGLQDVDAQLRLLAVPGENGVTLLDDTYNASPASMLAALNLLNELSGRKIAVLGNMLELGEYEQEGHEIVGHRAGQVADVVVAVGERGKLIGAAASLERAEIIRVNDNREAVERLKEILRPGDMVLIKGSRGAQMEEIVSQLAKQVR